MRKKTKCALIVATALTLLGIIILTGVMSMLHWNLKGLSTEKFETNRYEITHAFHSVEIRTGYADVTLRPTLDEKPSVVCHEMQKVKHTVTVEEGVLVIEAEDTRRWYDHIGIHFDAPSVTVYLPQAALSALAVVGTTGNVTVEKELVLESIDVTLTTGSIRFYASATGDIKLSTTTGNLFVEDVRARNITLSATTGSAMLEDVVAKEALSVTLRTGDVRLDKVDGAELFFKTTTGNVRGSLFSPKTFTASQTTGKVQLPETTGGGKCEIVTTTGSIKIAIDCD